MNSPAYRYAPGSGKNGPVAVRINHPEYVKDLLAQFRYLSHEGSFAKMLDLRTAEYKALEVLKANYPGARNDDGSEFTDAEYPNGQRELIRPIERKPRLRLYAAFRSRELTSGRDISKRGFVLENRLADPTKNRTAFAALTQMERGSAAHQIILKRAKAFIFAEGAGPIGRSFVVRGSSDFPKRINVPARKGTQFIERTWRLLLNASAKVAPKVEKAVEQAVGNKSVAALRVPLAQDIPMPSPVVRVRKSAKGSIEAKREAVRAAFMRVNARKKV